MNDNPFALTFEQRRAMNARELDREIDNAPAPAKLDAAVGGVSFSLRAGESGSKWSPPPLEKLGINQETNTVERTCRKCSKPLNQNNKSGTCTRCQKPGRYTEKAPVAGDAGLKRTDAPWNEPLVKTSSSTFKSDPLRVDPDEIPEVTKFRRLTAEFGVDGDQMLRGFCTSWINKMRAVALESPHARVPVEPLATGEGAGL